MGQTNVVLVSNRLPITIEESLKGLAMHRSIGGLATGLSTVAEHYGWRWIGWAGLATKLSETQREQLKISPTLIDVPIEGKAFEQYYNKLANGILWPIMHGFKPMQHDDTAAWAAVEQVIEQFATVTLNNSHKDDIIWVHDYHLVLLPEVLRRHGAKNRIGFFLHTPFPEPKLFLAWPYHKRVLAGLLAADAIGFQTPTDANHFKAAVEAAGLQCRPDSTIGAFPIGVAFDLYASAGNKQTVVHELQAIKRATMGKRIILSVSRLDYTKGIREQIEAFALAILKYKLDNVEYRLIVAPSREALREYRMLYRGIMNDIKGANAVLEREGRTSRIIFSYRGHGFDELNAWYRAADVFLVTPIIDGMNLVVKEYIAAHDTGPGSVVLSKTIGAAVQLQQAVLVDPENVRDIAEGISRALTMAPAQRQSSWQELRSNVEQEDVYWWANSFLHALGSK